MSEFPNAKPRAGVEAARSRTSRSSAAGHNGLVAAHYLAAGGLRTVVLRAT